MSPRRGILGSIHVLVFCLVSTTWIGATQVRPVNLEQMTDRAAQIFSARCIEARRLRDPELGRMVTVATFEVERSIKGDVGETVTVRMLAPGETGAPDRQGIAGMPTFYDGEEVVLFLYGESDLGMSSPVGLSQGKFSVYEDKQGRKVAVNAMNNKHLFRDLSEDARVSLGAGIDRARTEKRIEPRELLDWASSLRL